MSAFEENAAIIEQARETLMEADKIRVDPDFKRAMTYMRVQQYRGRITEAPSKENGYKIGVRK